VSRGDARRKVGEPAAAEGDETSSRSYLGRVTVSGTLDNGLKSALPKPAAMNLGIGPGDELIVEHDTEDDEIVLGKPEA